MHTPTHQHKHQLIVTVTSTYKYTLHRPDNRCHWCAQGQQKERQKKQLGVVDKMMYTFGQLVFGNQSARLFTFGYIAVLHLLVVASLMRMTHHSSGALYQHQQDVLDSRHDVTAALHHEVPLGDAAEASGSGADPRLP